MAKAQLRPYHQTGRPHRKLFRTARGEDVRKFQLGLAARLKHVPDHLLGDVPRALTATGVFDRATYEAWKVVRFAIGLPNGHPPTIGAQTNVRRPSTRTAAARKRAKQRKAGTAKPRIITARQQGLSFDNTFGGLGAETDLTGHHTAGPIDATNADAVRLNRQYHAAHKAKGWGGEGYHYNIGRDGTINCLRPTALKGAHVGGWNSNNIGISCHGTTGDKPTDAQLASLRWLLANAHTRAMPAEHRTDRDLRRARRRGHNDWPGHESNACPGTHKTMYLTGGEKR